MLDEQCEGKEFHGVPVLRGADPAGCGWDGMLITALEELEQVEARPRELGVSGEQIWRLS